MSSEFAAASLPPCRISGVSRSGSDKEVIRFLQIASASAMETESHLQMATDLGYLPAKASEYAMAETRSIQRMLSGLMKNLPP